MKGTEKEGKPEKTEISLNVSENWKVLLVVSLTGLSFYKKKKKKKE